MKQKVFVKTLHTPNVEITGSGGTETSPVTFHQYFKPDEDVTIIGVSLHMDPAYNNYIANDGVFKLHAHVAVSYDTVDHWFQELAYAMGMQVWNTAPASVWMQYDHTVMMFPEGTGLHLKEGEVVGLATHGENDSAGTVASSASAYIYYVKGLK